MGKPVLGMPGSAKPNPSASIQPAAPHLGAGVVVKTSEKIGGQYEHAALITRVHSGDLINVMVFPAEGQPYPIASINRETGLPSWHWPSRN